MAKTSILKLSEINSENRIDADYFKQEYLELDKKIAKMDYKNLNKLGFITDGSHEIRKYIEKGVIFLRVQDFFEESLDIKEIVYISKEDDDLLKRCKPKENDILITKTGKIGVALVVTHDFIDCNIPADIAIIKLKEKINPFFLSLYINSLIGRKLIERNFSGMGRQRIVLENLRKIKVPIIKQFDQEELGKKVLEVYSLMNKSKQKYNEAEERLNKELKIPKIKYNKIFIKSFLDIWKNKRIDAEYYKPKYEWIIKNIEKMGCIYIRDNNIKDRNFKLNEKQKYKYIELANINQALGLVEDFIVDYGSELPSRARQIVKEDDIIISSIEGSLNSSALIKGEQNNSLCSTGFFVINIEEYNPEFLVILMKNELIQSLLKRGCSGTILTAISKEELKRIPLPKIEQNIQKDISLLIKQSNELYFKAKNLMNEAKDELEKLINQSNI